MTVPKHQPRRPARVYREPLPGPPPPYPSPVPDIDKPMWWLTPLLLVLVPVAGVTALLVCGP